MSRGFLAVEIDGEEYLWKRCEVDGCEQLVCLGLSRTFCFPHSGLPASVLDDTNAVIIHDSSEYLQ